MRNATRYVAIMVIGIIALVIGVLYQVQALGYYPTRAIVLIVVGVILLISGIVGRVTLYKYTGLPVITLCTKNR